MTEVSSVVDTQTNEPGKSAVEYVATAVINDIGLLETFTQQNQFRAILYAALTLAINNALTEVQSIAFLAKDKNEFYNNNKKYIMIISMYQEIMQEKMKQFTPAQVANHLLIDQQKQLFVIMLSKLFQTIKRADIYFEDKTDYFKFIHMLPVQMYFDNVIAPELKKHYESQKKKNAKKK